MARIERPDFSTLRTLNNPVEPAYRPAMDRALRLLIEERNTVRAGISNHARG